MWPHLLGALQVQGEIRIHSQLQHSHIVAFYAAFEDSEHVYLALEYAAGKCSGLPSARAEWQTSVTAPSLVPRHRTVPETLAGSWVAELCSHAERSGAPFSDSCRKHHMAPHPSQVRDEELFRAQHILTAGVCGQVGICMRS